MARAGWVLRTLLLNDASGILRDRKSAGGRMVVRRCASGSELVDWILALDPRVCSRLLATGMWQALLEEGVLFHGMFRSLYLDDFAGTICVLDLEIFSDKRNVYSDIEICFLG